MVVCLLYIPQVRSVWTNLNWWYAWKSSKVAFSVSDRSIVVVGSDQEVPRYVEPDAEVGIILISFNNFVEFHFAFFGFDLFPDILQFSFFNDRMVCTVGTIVIQNDIVTFVLVNCFPCFLELHSRHLHSLTPLCVMWAATAWKSLIF